MPRLVSFDIAKALCIILVVIGHYIPSDSPQWYVNLRLWIYSFHMPLFMLASGYIYMAFKKQEPYLTFVAKKIRRLMIPYFVVSVIIVSIKLFTQSSMYVENPVTAFSFVRILYLPEAGFFLWFIWALFTTFLVVPLFKTRAARSVLFLVAIALHYFPIEGTPVFAIHSSLHMLVFFMLGVSCVDWKFAQAVGRMNAWAYRSLCILTVLIFACLSVLRFGFGYVGGGLLPWFGIASVMIVSVTVSRYAKGIGLKAVMAVSASNYIIYLFHTTFEGFAKALLQKLHIQVVNADITFVLGVVFVILCGIACPMLLHRLVLQKNKVCRVLFGLK